MPKYTQAQRAQLKKLYEELEDLSCQLGDIWSPYWETLQAAEQILRKVVDVEGLIQLRGVRNIGVWEPDEWHDRYFGWMVEEGEK